jgi:hypothetical protein
MDSTTGTMERGTASQGSPADNATYNLLQTLTSKLEAIEAYGKYMQRREAGKRPKERAARKSCKTQRTSSRPSRPWSC